MCFLCELPSFCRLLSWGDIFVYIFTGLEDLAGWVCLCAFLTALEWFVGRVRGFDIR